MKIKKFNEDVNRDYVYAISDSFNKVESELTLLNARLGYASGKNEELDEIVSEISQMKINFDELKQKFDDFDNRFFIY